MNIRPLYDRIVVKRIEEQDEKTASGIIIPDSAKEKPQEGEVVAVGKGKRLEDGKVVPLDVKVGDRILFGKYSGSEIKLDGERVPDHARGRSSRHSRQRAAARRRLNQSRRNQEHMAQNRLFIAKIPARRSCAVSTSSPTR